MQLRVIASLSLQLSSGRPGTRVTVSGSGAGERISIYVGEDLGEAKATANRQGALGALISACRWSPRDRSGLGPLGPGPIKPSNICRWSPASP